MIPGGPGGAISHRSKEDASKEAASKEETSKEAASKEEASKEATSKEKTSKEATSKEEASKEVVNVRSVPLVETDLRCSRGLVGLFLQE